MRRIRSMWLGEQLVEAEFTQRVAYGTRYQPATVDRTVLALFVNGRQIDHEKYWKLADHILEHGR